MNLDKFRPYEKVSGVASISLTKNGLGFSKTAVIKMGRPNFLELLINDDDKQLAFVATNTQGANVYRCMAGKSEKDSANFRINAKDLLYTISAMMSCSIDELNFRVVGEFFDNNRIMLVDLKKAKRINDNDVMDDE